MKSHKLSGIEGKELAFLNLAMYNAARKEDF